MKEISPVELKKILIDMLQDIHNFCEKNNIKYSVAYGTLLGAVRHKGFIPWDDDIDIMLPRKDYERFIESYGNDRYRVIDMLTNPNYGLPYAKVEDVRTIMDEGVCYKTQYGVFIDIFPVDNIPDDENIRKSYFSNKKKWNFIYNVKTVPTNWRQRSIIKNIFLSIGKSIFKPIGIGYVCKKLIEISKKYNNIETKCGSIFVVTDNKESEVFPIDMYVDIIKLPFENIIVNAVRMYDLYLKGCYGDYMKLPPIEKQISNHTIKAWWIN